MKKEPGNLMDGNYRVNNEVKLGDKSHYRNKTYPKGFSPGNKAARVPVADPEIIPDKWYPGSFSPSNQFIVIPQGFFFKRNAKKYWNQKLRMDSTNLIIFVKGKEVIDNNYELKMLYYIGKKAKEVSGRIIFPLESVISFTRKSYKARLIKTIGDAGTTRETEGPFIDLMIQMLPKTHIEVPSRSEIKEALNNHKLLKLHNKKQDAKRKREQRV